MKPADFRHLDRLRVRWAEVDMQRIVFNGHYLMYFDTAVAGYWRAMALPYERLVADFGGDLYVKKATLEYHASAQYDDQLEVGVRTARIGNSSILLVCAAFRAEKLLVGGELVYVFADPSTQTSKPVPPPMRAIFDAFESGAALVDVEVGDWAKLGADASALREAVFVGEQRIPLALERDAADAGALHAVARNRAGMAVATGRLLPPEGGEGRIGRMAVHRALRGAGLGRAVLDALCAAARARGDRRLRLHAQRGAVGFYRRLGWIDDGTPFDEAGLEHQAMVLGL